MTSDNINIVTSYNNNYKKKPVAKKQGNAQEKRAPTEKGGEARGFKCSRCGRCHQPRQCPAYGKTCKGCGGRNHFASECRSRKKFHAVEDTIESVDSLFIDCVSMDEINEENDTAEYDWYENIINILYYKYIIT